MGKFQDLTGMKFGKLTIVQRVPKPKDKKQDGVYWECLCDCGNICIRNGDSLKRAKKKGQISECDECRKPKDLTGMRFGRIVVIKRAFDKILKNGKRRIMWLCRCDCGNYKIIDHYSLIRNLTKSCGCIQKEKASEANKKYNTYNLDGEYGIGYTEEGEKFYFDLEDYDKIKDYYWSIGKKGTSNENYVISNSNNDFPDIRMHRIVTNCPDEYEVDHIHGKESRNDNRKSNLRIATHIQNNINKGLRSDNTTGITGVWYDKRRDKWIAEIKVNKKKYYLGEFKEKSDAIKTRKEAEEKYFGEWSYDNSQAM